MRFESTMTEMERYLSKVDASGGPDACWPWTGGTFDSGYGRFALSDAKRSSVRSHRWGYTQLVGPIPPGMIILHTCDTPSCHNPAHWRLGTNASNSADMVAKGRSASRTRNPASKLTEAQVVEVKTLLEQVAVGSGRTKRGQLTLRQIGERFGVSDAAIRAIRTGNTWS